MNWKTRVTDKDHRKKQNMMINRVLNYFVTENILPTNRLLKAAGCAVAKKKKKMVLRQH